MGFNLTIGEAIKDGDRIAAKVVRLNNAPADGVPTDRTNQRWPSYTGWTDFYEAVGLKEMFEKDILSHHPGFVELKQKHKQNVDFAYRSIRNFHPDHQPRLEWLKFWIDWALENCKRPVFVNT